MSSTQSLTRLAFRPLSSRCQCRFASNVQRPTSTRESAAGGLANDLLRSSTEKQRQWPTALAKQVPQSQSNSGPDGESKSPRIPARFMSIAESTAKAREAEQQEASMQPFTKVELERQAARKWQVGDLYTPRDLTGKEMAKWKKLNPPKYTGKDVFDQLGIDPMREYKNFSMMAEFVSETGRIKPRTLTGLRLVNQRKIARAIRRAMGLGLMPRTYKHPELLKRATPTRRRR